MPHGYKQEQQVRITMYGNLRLRLTGYIKYIFRVRLIKNRDSSFPAIRDLIPFAFFLPLPLKKQTIRRTARYVPMLLFSSLFLFPIQLSAQDEIILDAISFSGNATFSGLVLETHMTLKTKGFFKKLMFWNKDNRHYEYSENILSRDRKRLEKFYRSEGFLDAVVDTFSLEIKKNKADLKLFIKEGDSLIVKLYGIEPTSGSTENRARASEIIKKVRPEIALKTGVRYRDAGLAAAKGMLLRAFANAGFPYARIRPKHKLHRKENQLDLFLGVVPGPFCVFGEAYVEGNSRVPTDLILKHVAFKKGEIYREKLVQETQSQIYQLGIFQFVTTEIPLANEKQENVRLRIKVREAAKFTSKFGVGFGREDRLRLLSDARILVLGGGRKLNLLTKHSTLEPLHANILLSQPSFLEKKVLLGINPFYQRIARTAFEVEGYGLNISLQRPLARLTNGFLNYTLEQDRMLRGRYETRRDSLLAPSLYNKSAISVGFARNTASPIFSPERGTIKSATLTVSGFGFRSVKFVRFSAENRIYRRLNHFLIFAQKVKVGMIKPLENDQAVPKDELFYAGGSNSVRGWARQKLGPLATNQEPLGGRLFFEGSGELRFPVWDFISGTTFFDFGNVWRSEFDELRYAVGIGLRFDTMIGPARLDVAVPVFDKYASRREIHINIGHAF